MILIKNYKGSVVGSWHVPRTKRQTACAVRKLLRLYWRCKQADILTKGLFDVIKRYAEALYRLATEVFLINPELVPMLREVLSTKVEDLEDEVVVEKKRVHTNAVCSFCRTKLVYPAFIAYRKGSTVVRQSLSPVGIICLTRIKGRLNDLITEIEAVYGFTQPEQTHRGPEEKDTETSHIHSAVSGYRPAEQVSLF